MSSSDNKPERTLADLGVTQPDHVAPLFAEVRARFDAEIVRAHDESNWNITKVMWLGRKSGVEVQEVVSGSPAAKASLQSGDIIVAVDGASVARTSDLQRLMVEASIGKRAAVTVLRGDRQLDLEIVLAELT